MQIVLCMRAKKYILKYLKTMYLCPVCDKLTGFSRFLNIFQFTDNIVTDIQICT